jgi:signal transduction histidine kinase
MAKADRCLRNEGDVELSRGETSLGGAGRDSLDQSAGVALHGRAMAQPAAGIVHDLGNLIQVASSALNRVARDPSVSTVPALEPVIASARTALQRAGTLVRETLARAHESHRDSEHADVGACLAEVETFVRNAWDPAFRIELRVGSGLPSAQCDRVGLQSAVLNLIFNARDAMPDGGLISVAAEAVAQGAVVELRLEDRGIGMTKETLARAFDPFFTTKGEGLGGVGLPMVKHFAEEHGGSVEIESTLGSGTTVILRLPAVR